MIEDVAVDGVAGAAGVIAEVLAQIVAKGAVVEHGVVEKKVPVEASANVEVVAAKAKAVAEEPMVYRMPRLR